MFFLSRPLYWNVPNTQPDGDRSSLTMISIWISARSTIFERVCDAKSSVIPLAKSADIPIREVPFLKNPVETNRWLNVVPVGVVNYHYLSEAAHAKQTQSRYFDTVIEQGRPIEEPKIQRNF